MDQLPMKIQPPTVLKQPINIVNKILMGPGPSNAPERILKVLSQPVMGHLHPETLKIMDDIKEGIKYIFQTDNPVTMCVSASGHGGMDAALCNLLEDGDVALFGVTGLWGKRAGDMAQRYGADVRYLETKAGTVITLDRIEEYFKVHKPVLFFVAQGDSSTGVEQPLEGIGKLCRKYNCLFVVDTVASLGAVPFFADKWLVDVVYTCSQKVLGAPPGVTPITFSQRAMDKIAKRTSKIKVYYWDVNLLGDYWNCFGRPSRIYHHTISSTLLYGLREALAIIGEETLEKCIARHRESAHRLHKGIDSLGLEMLVERPEDRLNSVNAILVPKGVDFKAIIDYAMANYKLEISGGLGPTAGLVWRIGLLGINATFEKVDHVLNVLAEALQNASTFKPNLSKM